MFSGGPILWSIKKMYGTFHCRSWVCCISGAAQDCLWLRQLETELGCPPEGPTLIFENNPSAIAMARNLQFHGQVKHIDICHHFVREQVTSGTIKLDYCATKDMTADIMTKGLTCKQHCKLREKTEMAELH